MLALQTPQTMHVTLALFFISLQAINKENREGVNMQKSGS